ncbi:right-handed parallel beta-helix repeat-containing protein [Treponema denticola]|uniref:right-handed parallel beta-helix repeat-containing protein n=1 Tax=Treponema denticola TaxID=158 RepID=UPI003F50FD8A
MNTPPPEIGDITIAKTKNDGMYVLHCKAGGMAVPFDSTTLLHKDIAYLNVQKEDGTGIKIPISAQASQFDTSNGGPFLLPSTGVDPLIDTITSGNWELYVKTGTGLTASTLPQKYTVRLIDRKGLSSAPKEAKTLGYIPDLTGPGTEWRKLKQAVESAQEGGVITVMGNVKATNDPYNSGAIKVNKSLTIKGKIGITLDANSNHAAPLPADAPSTSHRIFTVRGDKTELTLENLTLKNGYANKFDSYETGGAIDAVGIKTLTLKYCTIKDCKAYNGGGIFLNGRVEATLESCTIMSCTATGAAGGAIYAGNNDDKQPVVRIKSGIIKDNTGHITGGAIDITQGSLYINTDENGAPDTMSTITQIEDNTVTASGGGGNGGGGINCHWDPDKPGELKIHNAKIKNCNIKYDTSGDKKAHGAGISVYGNGKVSLSNVTLSQCGFIGESYGNEFDQKQGGGIYLLKVSKATIEGCTFKLCKANQGGAFYIETGKANIENCTFIKNSASESGGALHIGNASNDCNVIISDSVIGGGASDANTASSKGGGICVYRGTCTVKKVNIQNNTAGIGGSGIWLHGAIDNTAKLTLEERVKIQDNHLMIGNNTEYPAFVTAHNLDAASDIKIRPEVYSGQINTPLVKAAGTKPYNWETRFELVEKPSGQTWELKKNDAGTELILKRTP